jgi:hypothetical protein
MNGGYETKTDVVKPPSDRNAFKTVDGQVLRHRNGSAAVVARFQTTEGTPERWTNGFEPTEPPPQRPTETIGPTKPARQRPTSPI